MSKRVLFSRLLEGLFPVFKNVGERSTNLPDDVIFLNDLPDDVICNIAIYADDTTLYSKCDQASDLWQQLELASELESDLRDTGLGQEVAC